MSQKDAIQPKSFMRKFMPYAFMTSLSITGAIATSEASQAAASVSAYGKTTQVIASLQPVLSYVPNHSEMPQGLLFGHGGIISSIFHGIGSVFHSIVHTVSSVVGGVFHAATSLIGGVVHAATSFVGGIVNTGLSLISHTVPIIGPIIGAVGSTVSHVVGTLAEQFLPRFDNGILGLIPPVISNALGGALSVGSSLSQTFGSFFPIVGNVVGGIIGGISGAVGGAIAPIASGIVGNVVEGASQAIHSIIPGGNDDSEEISTDGNATLDANPDEGPQISVPDAGVVAPRTSFFTVPASANAQVVSSSQDDTTSEPLQGISLLGG